MANSILTPTMVTRAALVVLHQKLNFIGSINRQYDDSFAKTGAKIGSQLRIRLPNQYVYRRGAVMNAQDSVEQFTTLNITNQGGTDLNFTSADLTLSIQDFTERFIEPAMAIIAANMEADAFTMLNSVYPAVNNVGAAIAFKNIMQGRKSLTDYLTPSDNRRTAILNTQDQVDLVDALKGLFHSSDAIEEQYKDGMMGRTGGFTFYENTIIPTLTTGTAASATTYTVNGASQTGSSIAIQGAATTFVAGDVITFAGCNRCHPETKADSGSLQQFVVTAAYAGGAGNIQVSPSITTTTGYQNVIASPTNGGAITKIGGASNILRPSVVFHEDAFTFATADLVMPKNQHFAAREQLDGISMRIWQGADIINDKFPCRVDVLYGYTALRPQLACRILSN